MQGLNDPIAEPSMTCQVEEVRQIGTSQRAGFINPTWLSCRLSLVGICLIGGVAAYMIFPSHTESRNDVAFAFMPATPTLRSSGHFTGRRAVRPKIAGDVKAAPRHRHPKMSADPNWATLPRPAMLPQIALTRVADGDSTDLLNEINALPGPTLVVLGTYPGDFNLIEYAQKLTHYMPQLQANGISNTLLIVNGERDSCQRIADLLELPKDIKMFADPSGEVGRMFGVSRGWLPDSSLPAELKLFGMLLGLGASSTLPSVISGYLGNPSGSRGWIECALAQGLSKGREVLGQTDLVRTDESGKVVANTFNELPVVGGWGRRPLELATLRLQNMLGISLKEWGALKPTDDRCLTQLGGCALYTDQTELAYVWRDNGICHTANFEDILEMKDLK